MSPAKTAEPIEMPFGMWTRVGPRNHVLDGLQVRTCEWQFCGRKWAGTGHARAHPICSKQLSRGQIQYGADADWDALDGMHVGAIWQIRLNRPCATAMRSYVKLRW